jgi:uncharacterized membrane protein
MPDIDAVLSEQKLKAFLGGLLRAGVIAAGLIVMLGGALYLIQHGTATPEYRIFRGEPADLKTVGGIFSGVISLRARAVIQLGLLLLIFTPVARVMFSLYAFAKQRDRVYVAVTLFVLGILIFSLAGGRF